jgi:hypothetical protein
MQELRSLGDFDFEDFWIRKLEAIPATDLVILSLGGFLGMKGWTPITALINVAAGAASGDVLRGNNPLVDLALGAVPFGPLIKILFGDLPRSPGPAPSADALAVLSDLAGRAALGAIEAYTLTRPGFVTGIVQGIGEILPL